MRHTGIRELIRADMLERARLHPLARPLSAKEIQARHPDWPLSVIYYHLSAIRAEADATVASCSLSNSDTDSEAA
ncbi:MAG: hypothetical protein WAU49_13945 [Steroidobacteraceae bacterium]